MAKKRKRKAKDRKREKGPAVETPVEPGEEQQRSAAVWQPRWREVAPYAPAALLLVVAAIHLSLVYGTPLTRWKGGGFGMFSTDDAPWTARLLYCYWIDDDGKERLVRWTPSNHRVSLVALALPSDENLTAVARFVSRRFRSRRSNIRAVRVEIWRRKFDSPSLAYRITKWRSIVHELATTAG